MARQPRQLMRQGVGDLLTRVQVDAYVGPAGEPIFDRQTLRVHDGIRPGGIPMLFGGHTPVFDADYLAVQTDTHIGFQSLTAARTCFFPDVDFYPFGQPFIVADESGLCSPDLPILLSPGPGSNDLIGDGTPLAITGPRQGLRFVRGRANLWILL